MADFALGLKVMVSGTANEITALAGKIVENLGKALSEQGKKEASKIGEFFKEGLKEGLKTAGIENVWTAGMGMLKHSMKAQQQRLKVTTAMGGNKEEAASFTNRIEEMGASTPFNSEELMKNALMLKQFGVEQEKLLPVLQRLGDITQGSSEKMNGLAEAYGHAMAAGKLQQEDLDNMLKNGFDPLQEMVRNKVYPSLSAAREAMQNGAVSSKMLELAFQSASGPGGEFFGAMNAQSDTTAAKLSNFIEQVQKMGNSLGNALLPALDTLLSFTGYLMANKDVLLIVAAAVATYTLAVNYNNIAQGIRLFLEKAVNAVANANPVLRFVSFILLLIGVIYALCKRYEGWGTSMKAIWEIIKSFVKLAGMAFMNFFETGWYWLQKLWLHIKMFAEYAVELFGNVGRAIQLALKFDFAGAKEALTAHIVTNAEKELDALEKNEQARRARRTNEANNEAKNIAEQVSKIHLTKKKAEEAKPPVSSTGVSTGEWNAAKNNAGNATGEWPKTGSLHDKVNEVTTGGGNRGVIINLGKFFDNIILQPVNIQEGLDGVDKIITERMRRILNSANV